MYRRSILFVALICSICLLAQVAPAQAADVEVENVIQTMITAIQDGNDPMRNKMFFRLRHFGQRAVDPLIAHLKDDLEGVPEYCAFTLGWIADPIAIEPIKELLTSDSPSIRRHAAKALANMAWGNPEPLRKTVADQSLEAIALLLKDPDKHVRQDAAYSLGLLQDERGIPYLERAKADPDDLVQWFAEEALKNINDRIK